MVVSIFQSTWRAVFQTGGFVILGGALLATSIWIPLVVGAALIGGHQVYDQTIWTEEKIIEYLKEYCVAHIEIQFEERRKEFENKINDIDQELNK